MNKITGKFLLFIILICFGNLLMPQAKLDLDVVKEPTFKELGDFWYVYMDWTCPRSKIGEMGKIEVEELKKQNIKSEWTLLTFFNWPETEEGELRFRRGVVVPKETKCEPPLKLTKFDKTKMLVYTITGDFEFEDIVEGNRYVEDLIDKRGYCRVFPSFEIYRFNPNQFHLWYIVEKKQKNKES